MSDYYFSNFPSPSFGKARNVKSALEISHTYGGKKSYATDEESDQLRLANLTPPKEKKMKDAIPLAIFLAVMTVYFYFSTKYNGLANVNSLTNLVDDDSRYIQLVYASHPYSSIVVAATGFAIFAGAIYYLLLASYGKQIIHTSFVLASIVLGAQSAWLFVHGSLVLGIVFALLTILSFVAYYYSFEKIDKTAKLLNHAIRKTMQRKYVLLVAVISSILAGLFCLYWMYSTYCIWQIRYEIFENRRKLLSAYMGFCVFVLFWVVQWLHDFLYTVVIYVIVRVQPSEIVADSEISSKDNAANSIQGTWYTTTAVKDILVYNAGSVSFGSLLISILKTLQFLADRNINNGCLKCIVDCIISCLASIMEKFNQYAYFFVAAFNMSYLEAGQEFKRTVGIKRNGSTLVDLVHKDFIVSGVLAIGVFLITILSGLFGFSLAVALNPDMDKKFFAASAMVSFLVGGYVAHVLSQVIQASLTVEIVLRARKNSSEQEGLTDPQPAEYPDEA